MERDTEAEQSRLGFLALYETANHDGYLGAILVTDMRGVPQEFRCTHPVKPTTIQRPLYGDALEPHIAVNLCGIPLITAIQHKPALVVVNREFLLEVRPASSCPIVFVRRAGEAIEVEGSSRRSENTSKRQRIDSSTGRFQPIIFIPHSDFTDDVAPAKGTLEEIFTHLDPLEPFERMVKAVEVLGKQDERFQ